MNGAQQPSTCLLVCFFDCLFDCQPFTVPASRGQHQPACCRPCCARPAGLGGLSASPTGAPPPPCLCTWPQAAWPSSKLPSAPAPALPPGTLQQSRNPLNPFVCVPANNHPIHLFCSNCVGARTWPPASPVWQEAGRGPRPLPCPSHLLFFSCGLLTALPPHFLVAIGGGQAALPRLAHPTTPHHLFNLIAANPAAAGDGRPSQF